MSFRAEKKARLVRYAKDRWNIDGHVLPYDLAPENLQSDVRASALEHFAGRKIQWWTSRYDNRGPFVGATTDGPSEFVAFFASAWALGMMWQASRGRI